MSKYTTSLEEDALALLRDAKNEILCAKAAPQKKLSLSHGSAVHHVACAISNGHLSNVAELLENMKDIAGASPSPVEGSLSSHALLNLANDRPETAKDVANHLMTIALMSEVPQVKSHAVSALVGLLDKKPELAERKYYDVLMSLHRPQELDTGMNQALSGLQAIYMTKSMHTFAQRVQSLKP